MLRLHRVWKIFDDMRISQSYYVSVDVEKATKKEYSKYYQYENEKNLQSFDQQISAPSQRFAVRLISLKHGKETVIFECQTSKGKIIFFFEKNRSKGQNLTKNIVYHYSKTPLTIWQS